MAKVILDAAHGGVDTGDIYQDWVEKENTLDLALGTGEILENSGVEVVYTRVNDSFVSINERINIALDENADLFISFHRPQYSGNINYSGVEAIVIYEKNGNNISIKAANNILNNLEYIGFVDHGIILADSGIEYLHEIDTPGMMLMVGFINSDTDNLLYENYFNQIVNAIAQGILSALEEVDRDSMIDMNDNYSNTSYHNTNNNTNENNENGNQTNYHYRVQVGLFRQQDNANRLQNELQEQGYNAQVVPQGEFYAVHVGDFPNLDEAAALERQLRIMGYNTLLVAV